MIKITKKTKPKHVKKARFWSVTGGCVQRPPIEVSKRKLETLPANAGFFVSKEKFAKQDFFEALDIKQAERAERHAVAHRLVKGSKSPTRSVEGLGRREALPLIEKFESLTNVYVDKKTGEFEPVMVSGVEFHENEKQVTPHGAIGSQTVVEYRAWADAWRVRTQTETTAGTLPPSQSGARLSDMLSERAAKKIAESCEYMALAKGGFKTFATGTFDQETRDKIKRGETSIQKEVSRFCDALQKMYSRGWVTRCGEKIAGAKSEKEKVIKRGKTWAAGERYDGSIVLNDFSEIKIIEREKNGLCYAWVVEIPKNKEGEDNPHIHMLMDWRVEKIIKAEHTKSGKKIKLFMQWANRIEKLWGSGTFHLEKIRDPECAGAYMAKAAGYMTKAKGDQNQGIVRGNRYGISEPARAPEWVTIGRAQLHAMSQIIADVYDHLTVTFGAVYEKRKSLNKALQKTAKDDKKNRLDIGKKLQAVRAQIKAIPIRCNKYQIILKGQTIAGTFFSWAKGEKVQRPEWLPELPDDLAWQEGKAYKPEQSQGFAFMREKFAYIERKNIKQRFQEQKILRRAALNTDEFLSSLVEKWERFKCEAFSGWSEYESLDLCQ